MRNFYSVSISGYHIAEAGANPITQLAFTLANGFTYVESYLARGMDVDDFAPNLSFFFSNGMDPEYTVIGRVARRIWAIAMRERYGADERSQKLKYHVQTSGRSLHAQEMAFNDIRTTLQALCAIYDNANSLHTNAYDEAVTTPTERVGAPGPGHPAHHQQGVGAGRQREPAAGQLHRRGAHRPGRGGRPGRVGPDQRAGWRARGHGDRLPAGPHPGRLDALRARASTTASLPIVGVNTFTTATSHDGRRAELELARSTEDEKTGQIRRLAEFHQRHADERPAVLADLQRASLSGQNVFAALMDAVRNASLGDITEALFEVGGVYRRNV